MDDIVKKDTNEFMPIGDGFDERNEEPVSGGGAEFLKFDAAAQNMWHGRDGGAGLYLGPYMSVKPNRVAEMV